MRALLKIVVPLIITFPLSANVCSAQNKQQPQPTLTASLSKPLDWGVFTARLFSDSSKVTFTLSTSWIPGENQKGMLRYKLGAFPESSDLGNTDGGAAGGADKKELMKRVSRCPITLQLFDADGFILRKIAVPFSLGLDDQAQVNSIAANDAAQMDAHSYRDFVGTSKRPGAWNVSWNCGPQDDPLTVRKPADEEDSKEPHRALEQLRAKAEAIKRCQEIDESISEFSMLKGTDAGQFRRRVSAPVNVTWDVEQRPSSIRSPQIGFIEFTTNASCDPTLSLIAANCRQKDAFCWAASRADSETYKQESEYCQSLKPSQYRYEFDFGTDGLEFSRALRKPENADKSLWAAIDLQREKDWTDSVAASSCVAEAVGLSIGAHTQDTSPGSQLPQP